MAPVILRQRRNGPPTRGSRETPAILDLPRGKILHSIARIGPGRRTGSRTNSLVRKKGQAMWSAKLLSSLFSSMGRPTLAGRRSTTARRAKRRPAIEPLEGRCLMAYNIVDLGDFNTTALNNLGHVVGEVANHAVLEQ